MSRYDNSALICLLVFLLLWVVAGVHVAMLAFTGAGCFVGLRFGSWLLVGAWRQRHATDPYAQYPNQPPAGWIVTSVLFEALLIVAVGLGSGVMFLSFTGVI